MKIPKPKKTIFTIDAGYDRATEILKFDKIATTQKRRFLKKKLFFRVTSEIIIKI